MRNKALMCNFNSQEHIIYFDYCIPQIMRIDYLPNQVIKLIAHAAIEKRKCHHGEEDWTS